MKIVAGFTQWPVGKKWILSLGVIVLGCAGSLIVSAAENRGVRHAIEEFQRPVRLAVEPFFPIWNRRHPVHVYSSMPTETLSIRPRDARPQAVLPPANALRSPLRPKPPSLARQHLRARGAQAVATNYCVRLCDGFAFPVGATGTGSWNVQEAACRSACPGAETALFSSPAGAKDFNSLSRNGLAYSALPNAFRCLHLPPCGGHAIGARPAHRCDLAAR
jgi:hypothetical protein